MTKTRRHIPDSVRRAVLTEAGFRCAVPTCRAILAIDLHHIVPVSDNGTDTLSNLLALCPTCHALHHRGTIPSESISTWKEALVNCYRKSPPACHSHNLSSSRLRVLYFHDRPRSCGFDYIRSRRLVQELEKRGHDLCFCWGVHPPLQIDEENISKDFLLPDTVRKWQPQALIFESGLFIGLPRIPLDLLDELEATGAVAIIAIPPEEYENHRSKYDNLLGSRGISVPTAEHEEPRCQGNMCGGNIVFSSNQLGQYSVAGDAVLDSVSFVRLGAARPMTGTLPTLIVGQENVFVKAYHNRNIHGVTYPVLGVLNDKNYRTEAIFLSDIALDFNQPTDNPVYLANLLEWLSHLRLQSHRWSADSTDVGQII